MPNWCANDLWVRGAKGELEKFKEAVGGKDRHGEEKLLNEENIIPYPYHFALFDKYGSSFALSNPPVPTPEDAIKLELLRSQGFTTDKDGFNQGGYEWCVGNWGTKWGFCHVELVEESDGELQYSFDTAWSPPLPLVRKLGEMFPDLEFELRYFEGGMGFNGILQMAGGKEEREDNGPYFGDRGG